MDYQVTTINNITILPSNIYFREMASVWAAEKNLILISDCTELWKEEGSVFVRKPSTDGKNFTKYMLDSHKEYLILMRISDGAKDFIDSALNGGQEVGTTIVSSQEAEIFDRNLEVLSIERNPGEIQDIKEAELIFAGGRGIMNQESFDALRKLASRYDASVGASRPMVDQGWAAWEEQVGQTGSVVKPKVYVAFGISGAVQHITGIEKSKNIIAVNLNKGAPIFRYANYSVYADDNSIIRNMLNIIDDKTREV